MTKAELLEEVEKRRAIGRVIDLPENPTNADIQAALDLDDEDAAEHAVKESGIDNLPDVATKLPNPIPGDQAPTNDKYKGVYVSADDGEEYALAVLPFHPQGKTHCCKNRVHYWQGTKEQFRQTFEKK